MLVPHGFIANIWCHMNNSFKYFVYLILKIAMSYYRFEPKFERSIYYSYHFHLFDVDAKLYFFAFPIRFH